MLIPSQMIDRFWSISCLNDWLGLLDKLGITAAHTITLLELNHPSEMCNMPDFNHDFIVFLDEIYDYLFCFLINLVIRFLCFIWI